MPLHVCINRHISESVFIIFSLNDTMPPGGFLPSDKQLVHFPEALGCKTHAC